MFFQAMPSPTPTPSPKSAPAAEVKEVPPVVTKHSVRIGSRTLNYTVTTGYLPIKNDKTEVTEANIFYMAYTLDGAEERTKRPLTFSFNGGPGSASVWLHMGALGPKRVKMLDNGMLPPMPYELVTNDQTWLDMTDIVFLDPVGTGFSRATKPEFASKFFGVNGDIESIGDAIRLYLVRGERWTSPLFLIGESYGTTRAAGLSNHLFERGISLNGIFLISTVLNFQTIRFASNNDLPLVLIFPSYTATAWYHKKLAPEWQSKPLREVLNAAEDFAANEYGPAMLRIDRLSDAERDKLTEKFAALTGLSKTYVANNNFRIDLDEFNKELLRDSHRTTGRLDSRFTGIDRDSGGESNEFDPSMSAIRGPYTATFNDYVRRDLGFRSDLEYYILGGGVTSPWNWNTNNRYADTSISLSSAMRKNPYMKVFMACGFYDMATPYFAAEYTISALNLDPELRKNISVSYYEAGHMFYIEKNSLKKLKDDAASFLQKAVAK